MAVSIQKQISSKLIISWLITLGLPLIIMLIPANAFLTHQIKLFLAITLAAITTFVFENINNTAVTIGLPILYVLLVKVPAATVFQPWSMSLPWSLLGGFLLAVIMERTGLLNRIAYKCILLTGASYNGIIWGLSLAGIILYAIMPGNAVVPLAALAYGVCVALNLPKGRESAGITLAAACAALVPGKFLFNTGIFMSIGLASSVTGPLTLGWFEYFLQNWVMLPYYLSLFFVITKMFKPNSPINGKEYFQQEYKKLGQMKSDEKKILITVALLFIFILTSKLHHIDVLWGFAFIPLLMYLPGLNAAVSEDFAKVNWSMLIFTIGCLSIGTTAGALGLGQIVSQLIVPIICDKSITFFLGLLYISYFFLNFLLTPLAMVAAFTLPLAQIAMDIGLNPLALYMFLNNAGSQILLPYEIVLWLIFFSFGKVLTKDFAKFMGCKALLNAVFVFSCLLPWWSFTGFLHL